MRTVNKDVEKMQEIGEKRRKFKIIISRIHYDGKSRAKIGRFAAEKMDFRLSVIKPNHAHAFLLLYVVL